MLADFVSDLVWSLRFAAESRFDLFRAEVVTRVVIAEDIAARLVSRHALRPDRAMAEAIMIVEVVAASEHWEHLVPSMRP